MVSEVQSESVIQKFRVRFRNSGVRDSGVWVIPAATFRRVVAPEDLVKFFDANNVEIQNIFLRGDEVSAIAPDADLELTTPVIELQHYFKSLSARVDALENSLTDIGDIVTRAINAAFAARGM